ncbi:MAG: DUF952 domain-containing protein [Chitinophagaceae bacterium]|nr:DUF952 domain-containing protein [Chitinophagaceae bacterium]
MESDFVYHVTSPQKWAEAQTKGQFETDSLVTEGFIHCSTDAQIPGVLERYYKGQKDLLKLKIQKDKVERPLIFELAGSINEVFPHIHGAINLDAIVEVTKI